jgi:uncharacterized OB-fold protein
MSDRVIPAPPMNGESEPFYRAAREGRFMIRVCTECKKPHWYPRTQCPYCLGETVWMEASGKGEIYSYSVMRRADPPYAIAYVTLAEGPKMMTNLVECDFNRLAIGQSVELVLKPTEGGPPVPCFRPRAKSQTP